MKGTLDFNPEECSYGAATLAVRQIFAEWADVDWFVPPTEPAAESRAVRLLEAHGALAHAFMPALFPSALNVEVRRGEWADFHALTERVRSGASGWDWKFSALKKLSRAHSKARGWSEEDHARTVSPESPPRPGELFFRIGDVVIWTGVGPKMDLTKALRPRDAEVAAWYRSFANMDVTDCIVWQLAEATDATQSNPFLPLLRCYAEGFYPFGLSATELVLFAFDTGSAEGDPPT